MGTYMGAYGSNSGVYHVKSNNKYIIIESAKCIDYYHYHGSMGEWTWELTDINGEKYKVDTWYDYEEKDLKGQKVMIQNGDFKLA